MNEIRLIEILKTFSIEEIKSLKKFLNSPFIKSRRNLNDILEYIIQYHPLYDSPKINKQSAFKKLFPEENFNDKKIQNLLFDLTKAVEDFLIHNILEEDEEECMILLSKAFYKRKLSDYSMKTLKQIEKKLEPNFSPQKDYVSKFRRLTNIKISYHIDENDFANLLEEKRKYFEAASVQFIIDYAEMLQVKNSAITTHGKNLSNVFIKSLFESFNIEKLINVLGNSDYAYAPLIEVYFYKLKTIEEPEKTEYFFKLKESLLKILPIMDREEKHNLFNYLATYCSVRVNKKDSKFIKEGLEVYKSMLENNAYSISDNENMQILTYRNIYLYCYNIEETVWFREFIEKFTDKLNSEHRDDMRNLAYAYLNIINKEFETALVYVSKINHEFFLLKTDVKNLLLFLYYELDYVDQAYSLVDSYKHFLTNTKEISDTHKELFNNFLKNYFDLLKIKSGQSKEDPSFCIKKIEKETKIVSKNWLLSKANELIKKNK